MAVDVTDRNEPTTSLLAGEVVAHFNQGVRQAEECTAAFFLLRTARVLVESGDLIFQILCQRCRAFDRNCLNLSPNKSCQDFQGCQRCEGPSETIPATF